MIHGLLAGMTKIPEWDISEFEAKELAKAVADVGRHYPAFQTSEKANDWLNLIMCAGMIYGTRVFATIRIKRMNDITPQALRSNVQAAPGVVTPPENSFAPSPPRQAQPSAPSPFNGKQMKPIIPGVGEANIPDGYTGV